MRHSRAGEARRERGSDTAAVRGRPRSSWGQVSFFRFSRDTGFRKAILKTEKTRPDPPGELVCQQADGAVDRFAAERVAAAVELAAGLLGPELAFDRQGEITLDLPVHGLEVVADRRRLVERDVDRAVHRLDAALLERPLERQAHGAVDRRSARRAFDVRELDRAVHGVARERAQETRREDLSIA